MRSRRAELRALGGRRAGARRSAEAGERNRAGLARAGRFARQLLASQTPARLPYGLSIGRLPICEYMPVPAPHSRGAVGLVYGLGCFVRLQAAHTRHDVLGVSEAHEIEANRFEYPLRGLLPYPKADQ